MRKIWIVVLAIVLVLCLGMGLMLWAFFSLFSEREPSVPSGCVLTLTLSGELPETAPASLVPRLFSSPELTFQDVIRSIDRASGDSRIRGIWMRVEGPGLGWGKVKELQDHLETFKKSGKFILASSDSLNERDYACALPADRIYLSPEAGFEFNGFTATSTYLKDMFEKIGVEPEVENIGKYKSFGDMLKRNSMSDAEREVANSMLDETVSLFSGMVSHFRKGFTPEKVKQLLEEGLTHPRQAQERNLVDGILYTDEVERELRNRIGQRESERLRTIDVSRYRAMRQEASGNQVAVIYAVGAITRGEDTYSPIFGRSMGSDPLVRALREARDNPDVKAIVLRIDSPGGDALASDLMWRELRLANQKKPVIASMSDVAGSGGYYIAAGCRKIVAEPGTVTGSIGVVSAAFNLQKLYEEKLGLRFETVKRGQWADSPSGIRPMSPEEWDRFRAQTRRFYETFLKKVADSRHRAVSEIETVAQGRVWTGRQAQEHGLVDVLGGQDTAVLLALKEAGLEGKAHSVVDYPRPKKLSDLVFEALSQDGISERAAARTFSSLPPELRKVLKTLAPMSVSTPSVLAVMPCTIDIH